MRTKKFKKLSVVFVSLMVLAQGAQAEDVYNFYFQKSGDKKQKEAPVEEKAVILEEPQEQIVEVPNDVLLVPDNWKPANSKKKKVYVRRRDLEESARSEVRTEAKKEDRDSSRSGWSMNLGVGGVRSSSWGSTLNQSTYIVGARYHMSRYFDVNGQIHVSNGDFEYEGFNYETNDSLGPQALIGFGVTPIHLNVFGGEFLEIGADGGMIFGDRAIYTPNSYSARDTGGAIYLGPRVSMKFGDHVSLMYGYKKNIFSDADFRVHSLAMAYRW